MGKDRTGRGGTSWDGMVVGAVSYGRLALRYIVSTGNVVNRNTSVAGSLATWSRE